MRYAFIINPAAGQRGCYKKAVRDIHNLIHDNKDADIKLFTTDGEKDAGVLSEALADEAVKAGEDIVIFGCGGDGTAHEVANGIFGYDNAILGIVPMGSGNDLLREISRKRSNFKDYLDPKKQMKGSPAKIDVMGLSWESEGKIESCISLNSINVGFDGNTAVRASELKETPFIAGSFAYLLAVFGTLIKKEGQSLRITADDELFHDGELLLSMVGNGGYCGGGIRSCPFAALDDGRLELMAVRDITRKKFIRLFPRFRAGRIFETEGIEEFIKYRRAKSITIEPLLADRMKFVTDGEVLETGRLTVEVRSEKLKVWELE